MPDPRREAERWLVQARRDLDDARFNAAGGRHHLACFLSQQAAEKALKAFLFARGHATVWGRSVRELCKRAAREDERFAGLSTAAGKLDRFYIPTRYPNGLPGEIPSESFDEEDSKAALELAEKVIRAVESTVAA